jgi:hypothetical protein
MWSEQFSLISFRSSSNAYQQSDNQAFFLVYGRRRPQTCSNRQYINYETWKLSTLHPWKQPAFGSKRGKRQWGSGCYIGSTQYCPKLKSDENWCIALMFAIWYPLVKPQWLFEAMKQRSLGLVNARSTLSWAKFGQFIKARPNLV